MQCTQALPMALPVPMVGGQPGELHPGRQPPPAAQRRAGAGATRAACASRTTSKRHASWCCRTCAWWSRSRAAISGYGLPHADLIQEGNVGLMKAVKRFDPERGVRLVSFAIHWIKAEIHEYILRNWRLVKIATTKAQRKLFFNLRSMKQGLAPLGAAEIARVAAELKVKPEEVAEMETRLAGHEVAFEARRRRRGGLRADALPRRRPARPSPRSVLEAQEDERAGRRRPAAGARGARCAQPAHRRGALAAGEGRRRRCTTSPPSSRSRPSASARSRRRRSRR